MSPTFTFWQFARVNDTVRFTPYIQIFPEMTVIHDLARSR
jgi:hypothetical protein